MPIARTESQRKQASEISRTDSLRSERSDKKVSFNNDVGVKHIPRGLKDQAKKLPKDEWANCARVQLEKPTLSSTELERQAEDLVKLLDQVDCVTGSKPINSTKLSNLEKNNKNKDNNSKNNTEKKNNLIPNGNIPGYQNNRSIPAARTKNPIKSKKDNIDRHRHLNKINNQNRVIGRRGLSTNDIHAVDSDLDYSEKSYPDFHKSVPDLPTTIYYNNDNQKNLQEFSYLVEPQEIENNKNFMSVDNLFDTTTGRRVTAQKSFQNRYEYKSADNLTDISIPGNRKLTEYKPYENLRSGFSSTTDIKMNDTDNYNPKVENFIRRLNSDPAEPQVRTHKIYIERGDDNTPSYLRSNALNSPNRNKPFSYSSPLHSVEAVRRMSPTRDTYKTKDDVTYSQVNKRDKNFRVTGSTSREYDRNSKNTDSDYSAKIIITGSLSPRYDEDDHAYETYQVGRNRDYESSKFDNYNNSFNNNMNMSSIGVQTDVLPKAPLRSRRNVKSMSPIRTEHQNGYGNDLSSASLVRRINHGFGRFDRSPSPTHNRPPTTKYHNKTVVPLLSDTDESEFGYRKRVDPLAKIRNQVMVREKLQEEKEAEEREELLFERLQKHNRNYDSSDLQPLTIDEVDALTLEVDNRSRNKLLVAQENRGKTHHKSESNINRVQSAPPKVRTSSPTTKKSIFSTLERLKKNKDEKEKEKNNTLKKKKKIKIKFFYDPRPQDKPNEDPLRKFTEYKGAENASPRSRRRSHEDDPYEQYYKDSKNNFRSLPRDTYLAREERKQNLERKNSMNDNSSPVRPKRNNYSRDRSRDNSHGRYGRDSSSERVIVVSQSSKTPRDFSNSKYKSDNRVNYNSTDRKNYREDSGNEGRAAHFNSIRNKFSTKDKEEEDQSYRKKTNYFDSDQHDSSDHGPSLSDKYKNLRNNEELERQAHKNEKILRQRNKFLGTFLGDARSKSPPSKVTSYNVKESSNIKIINRDRDDASSSIVIQNKLDKTKDKKSNKKVAGGKKRRKGPWPWSLLGLRRASKDPGKGSRPSSRASSRASSARRPTLRSSKIRKDGLEPRSYIAREREADDRETYQWESATLSREKKRVAPSPPRNNRREPIKYSADSSPSSTATPVGTRVARITTFQQRNQQLGDPDRSRKPVVSNTSSIDTSNYRSLPNRKPRTYTSKQNSMNRKGLGMRKISPGARGSAGSSLQSSESEADSQGGSHASRASHISTGSNRSVYLHATAVADIPVRRNSDDNSERGVSRQTKKVARSFSLVAPWKPKNYRERYEIEYDNREARDVKPERKSALPPRPPRKSPETYDNKKVGRSQTVYKDSKLAGWLRRKRNKEAKGI